MNSADRIEFEALMEKLCAGFNVPCTEARKDAYFTGLAKMTLVQFAHCVESALDQGGPEKIPTVNGIWQLRKQSRQTHNFGQAQPSKTLPERDSKWLAAVNQLFLRYLAKRRMSEGFTGDINLEERRAECLRLKDFFEAIDAEGDPSANKDELAARFDRAMQRIQDVQEVAAVA